MTETPLERLAKRASTDPFFLGFRLAEFADVEQFDDAALAARLDCDVNTLTHLRLCRAPRVDDPTAFREDVMCIAHKFGLDAHKLAAVAKRALATIQRETASADTPGVMLAARDQDKAS
ncbi:MAG: hypothetical protein L0241_25055 [Planctomycetia bacterium]|nr:hypothetical protein [Planctomycetia bacterium]